MLIAGLSMGYEEEKGKANNGKESLHGGGLAELGCILIFKFNDITPAYSQFIDRD
jgi:hypothetical protein